MNNRYAKVLLLVAAILPMTVAFAQPPGGPHGGSDFGIGGHMLGFFTDYLDLTDAQQAQAKDIMAKEQPAMKPYMDQLRQAHDQLWQVVQSGNYDEAKVRALASQNSQATTELLVLETRMHSDLYQILTPDQKAKMNKFMSRHAQRSATTPDATPSPQ
jgi:periplasmic protein CpxP/Spy